jgi:hypothetical protein
MMKQKHVIQTKLWLQEEDTHCNAIVDTVQKYYYFACTSKKPTKHC